MIGAAGWCFGVAMASIALLLGSPTAPPPTAPDRESAIRACIAAGSPLMCCIGAALPGCIKPGVGQ